LFVVIYRVVSIIGVLFTYHPIYCLLLVTTGMTKYFTVAEANRLLPHLRVLVEQMFTLREKALTLHPEVLPILEKAASNGGSHQTSQLVETFRNFEKVVSELQQLGCELKGVEQGLIDFPAMREGRVVYLCWQYDEPEVAFWHEVDAGFAGRQPL
jgi:hypothetical protein